MRATVEMDKSGRLVVPKKMREALHVQAGALFEVEERDEGIYLRPLHREPLLVRRGGLLVMAGGPSAGYATRDLVGKIVKIASIPSKMEHGNIEVFLDTSVLIAASDAEHPHHEASIRYSESAETLTTCCAAHSLAEVYGVLSRLPGGKRVRPEMASALAAQIAQRMTVVLLTGEDYLATIATCADAGLAGGKIYDALLLMCARKIDAEWIVTWNLRHFQEIAPDLKRRIVEPSSHA